jgi:hypothetical protein
MPDPSAARKWDRATAGGLGAAFFALYLATLCRTVYWYDSAELVTAAVTLGITHPPGYPVYTWLAHAFTWLPMDPAVAVNTMSATLGSAAVGLVFSIGRELGLARVPSAVGATTLGAGPVFWSNAVVAEVYCPAIAAVALVIYLLLRGVRERRRSLTLSAALIAGVSLGLHMSIATLGLGFAWLVWLNGRCWKRTAAAAGLAALGTTVFLFVPLRAAQDPPLNVCDPSSLEQFLWYVSGGAYSGWFGSEEGAWAQLTLVLDRLQAQLGLVGIGLAGLGAAWLSRTQTRIGVALGLMILGNVVTFFRYQAHDVEVFLLPTTLVLCLCVGAGVQALAELAARLVPETRQTSVATAVALVMLVLPVQLARASYGSVDMSSFDETEPYIERVVETLPENAIILNFTTPDEWKRYAVFGMYAQLVRGQRNDVKHLLSPDLRKLARDFDSMPPIYAYAPVSLLELFEVEEAGPLLRVLAPKPGTAKRAPRRGKKRNCRTMTELEVRDEG